LPGVRIRIRFCPELSSTDDEVGHVSGSPVYDETCSIRFLVTDTSNGWVGHDVPVAPPWIQGVQWSDQAVSIDTVKSWEREQLMQTKIHLSDILNYLQ
jgi:hypothetical protein